MAAISDNTFKFKLTPSQRRRIRKAFGEEGYQRFLWLNSMGVFNLDDDPLQIEILRRFLTRNTKPLESEMSKLVDENFWELV